MTDQSPSSNVKGALAALMAFGVFAGHDVIIKIVGGSYSPIQIVFFSVLFSFPLAMLYLMRDVEPGTLLPRHPWWMLARSVSAVITGFSAFYAFTVLPLAQTYAILFASPLLITILAIPILRENVGVHRWIAVLIGLAGVMVVLRPGETEFSLGHLAAISAAIFGALTAIIVRKIGREERMVVMLVYPIMANFIVMGIALAFVYVPMPIKDLGAVAVIALLAWIAGRFLVVAYQEGEAAIVAPMQYSQIIWASFYGWFIFSETLDMPTLLGTGIIILSGLYIVLREATGNASENTPVLRTRSRAETGTTLRIGAMMRASHEQKKD